MVISEKVSEFQIHSLAKGKGSLPKKNFESLSIFIRFLSYSGCLVHCETDFVTFWINFDQNNATRRTAKI